MLTMQELKDKFNAREWVDVTWTDLVLEQLAPNEVATDPKNNKYPKVRGLRRIGSFLAEAFIDCEVIHCGDNSSSCKATAYSSQSGTLNNGIIASSMAEATPQNVNHEMIAKHLLATAESRAEGRCWTKVLKLNCLTAEEMSLGTTEDNSPKEKVRDINEEDFKLMSDIQRKTINAKSKKLEVNPAKIGEIICTKNNLDVKLHMENGLSKEVAEKVLEVLNGMEQGTIALSDKTKGFVKL